MENTYPEKLAAMADALSAYCARSIDDGDIPPHEAALEIIDSMPEEMLREVFFQIAARWLNPDAMTRDWRCSLRNEGKHAAVEVAELMGPDFAEPFQSFATLVNKLA